MSALSKIKNLGSAIAVVVFLFAGWLAQGMPLSSYDLDSQVYMCSQIVEVQLVSQDVNGNPNIWEVKIKKVHEGEFKTGQTLDVVYLNLYQKAIGGMNTEKMKKGDQLFLFLKRATEADYYGLPKGVDIYMPVWSGVRLVDNEKAVDFRQFSNPGPYVAVTWTAATNDAVLTVEKFRQQIYESIPHVAKWKSLLERSASNDDVSALLQLLRDRSGASGRWDRDAISETVCSRLAHLHNVNALVEALHGTNLSFVYHSLGRGFGTPAGREFLLTTIADINQPIAERRKYASLLREAGEVYFSTNNGSMWNGADRAAIKSNGHYLKRIAQITAADDLDMELRLDLLKFFQQLPYGFDTDIPAVTEDVKDAEVVLKWFLEKTASEDLKYELERALTINRDEKQLDTNWPPIISILKPRKPHDNYHAPLGRFSFEYDLLSLHQGSWTVRLVFADVKNGRQWIALSSKSFTGRQQAGGSDEVSLPENIPHGHYRVSYEFLENGRVVCASHYFETDL